MLIRRCQLAYLERRSIAIALYCSLHSALLFFASLLVFAAQLNAQQVDALRYCNPLPISPFVVEQGRQGSAYARSMADPTAIRYNGKWYLFPTGGMGSPGKSQAWVSEDFVHWQYHPLTVADRTTTITAPTVAVYRGKFYLVGNGTGLYRSDDPLGPYEFAGAFKDNQGKLLRIFDAMIFVDDDQRVYLYTGGISGVELSPDDLTRAKGPQASLFGFQKEHVWERRGEGNQDTSRSAIEAPWMTKRNGVYYLQYSAPGTQWKNYAVGLYTSRSPLGPFVYDERSPILHDRGGLLNGAGHNSIVEGPGGTYWMFYHVLYGNNGGFERRLAMDPVGFDAQGRMFVKGPSETPQWAPGVKTNPALDNDSGSVPLSINTWAHQASSSAPGREPAYALDNNVRTWWAPAGGDSNPWLAVDLMREYTIDSARILFSDHGLNAAGGVVSGSYQYRLEVSIDGKEYRTVVDKSRNSDEANVEFDEIPPVNARWLRMTLTNTPKNLPLGILELTVFGKP
jgi:xylan 1,4-beta-xylosidase